VYGTTKKEVQDKLQDIQNGASDGRFDCPEMTVKSFLKFWLAHIKARVRRSTY
jgi:hypothetical protein